MQWFSYMIAFYVLSKYLITLKESIRKLYKDNKEWVYYLKNNTSLTFFFCSKQIQTHQLQMFRFVKFVNTMFLENRCWNLFAKYHLLSILFIGLINSYVQLGLPIVVLFFVFMYGIFPKDSHILWAELGASLEITWKLEEVWCVFMQIC